MFLFALILIAIHSASSHASDIVLHGVVEDAATGQPLSPATVRIDSTYLGTITNQQGEYELRVQRLPVRLIVSHIGYESATVIADVTDDHEVRLLPITYEMEELVVTAEDPAVSIMRKVIEAKRQWRSDLKTFRVDAYNRFTHRKDSTIVSVIESLSEAYWDHEKGWREVVKSRRQTENIDIEESFPAAVFVDNLYEDNVLVAGHRLMGVTHAEALDIYDFTLAGRRRMDDRTVYDIDVRSKSPRSSAFTGRIAILDEVYAMLEADLRPNESFIFPPPLRLFKVSYRQQFSDFGGRYWLPVGNRADLRLDIGIVGFRIPSIRGEQVSRLSNYEVNVDLPDSLYQSEDQTTVDSASVQADTLLASGGLAISLEPEEQEAYATIDKTQTLEKIFKPEGFFARLLIRGNDKEDRSTNEDGDDTAKGGRKSKRRKKEGPLSFGAKPMLWYNRVDATRIGGHVTSTWDAHQVDLDAGVGYSTGPRVWNRSVRLAKDWGPFSTHVSQFDGIEPRYDSDLYSQFSASSVTLVGKDDYFDYVDTQRWRGGIGLDSDRLNTSLRIELNAEQHRSVSKSTDYSVIRDFTQRSNPMIDAGDLSSMVFTLSHKQDVGPPSLFGQERVEIQIEHASPDIFAGDFDFTRIHFLAAWRFPTFYSRRLIPNVLDVRLVASTSRGHLPRQRFSILDISLDGWNNPGALRSLVTHPYEGEKALGLTWEHHFRTLPFEWLGWDAFTRRSIGLTLYGGHGRTWISDTRLAQLADTPQYQDRFHHEVGISINGIFSLFRVDFTQRLDRSEFMLGMGIARLF